jgi:hypothetical protein
VKKSDRLAEWQMANGEWQMANAKRHLPSAFCHLPSVLRPLIESLTF